MPPEGTRTSTAERLVTVEAGVKEICRRFEGFEERMNKVLEEIKDEIRTSTRLYNSQQVVCAAREAILNKVDEKSKDLDARLKKVEELAPAIKIIIWVGGVIGVSIIALIWALITGQAAITFK